MSDAEDRRTDSGADRDGGSGAGPDDRSRTRFSAARASVASASERHVAVAVPFRAATRSRRVAATVLAGGFAYRLFLWMLPAGLIFGGALGLMNANSTEEAIQSSGLQGAIGDAVGDAARSAQSATWWLLAVGVPLLLWVGYSGAKAAQLIHALVWDEPPPKTKPLQGSLVFTATAFLVLAAGTVTWWFRDETPLGTVLPAILTIAPLAALWLGVSLLLPHGDASWRELLPGALLVSVGFVVLHELIGSFLAPKLKESTSLYGDLGATATFLFFMYAVASLVVAAPVLNSSLHDELCRKREAARNDETVRPAEASPR